MGRVYLARNTWLDTLHAVKVLHDPNPRLADRLRNEGEAQRSLRHPHVVEVFEVVEGATGPALVMEYVAGPRLDDLLAAHQELEVDEIAHLGLGILEGVAAAHRRGQVHRDLKPANILLELRPDTLIPKIADFGLVKLLDDGGGLGRDTTQRAGMGTRRYMSLEQLTGRPAEPKMDVFALGAVLFELIEGRPAFPTEAEWHAALERGTLPRVDRTDVPEAWSGLVEAALAHRVDRIADAPAMLERWMAGVVGAPRASSATLAWADRLKDHPAPSALTGAALSAADAAHLTACPRCRESHRQTLATAGTWAVAPSSATAPKPQPMTATHQAALAQAAHPGQQLVTADEATRLELAAAETVSHGRWQVLGELEPVEVLALGTTDAARRSPRDHPLAWSVVRSGEDWVPARTVDAVAPRWPGAFVGRGPALADFASATLDHRWVTVHGPPGVGKSRLVAEGLWRWRGSFLGGVFTCLLSRARSGDVLGAVATVLGVPLAEEGPVAQLGRVLARRGRCVLVLDGGEHLAADLAPWVDQWLAAAPELVVVVTSQLRFGEPEAHVIAVLPLDEGEREALFHRRAAEADPTYDATSNGSVVAELARALDGLPLAIELCAARLGVLSPARLHERLAEPLRLLVRGRGASRYDSLRHAIDWSWQLLEPAEQQAMAQLSVFAGPFDLDAAEHVLERSSSEPSEVLQRLADAGMMVVYRDGGRLDLLPSLRAYAAEHLAPEARHAAEIRHGAWYGRLGPPDAIERVALETGRVDVIIRDLDNLLAAHARAKARSDAETACRCALAAWSALSTAGSTRQGERLLTEAAALPGAWHRAGVEAAHAQIRAGEVEAARRALLALTPPDAPAKARQGEALAFLALRQGDHDDAKEGFERTTERFRALGDRLGEARVTGALGNLAFDRGHYAEAERHHLECLELHRSVGSDRGLAITLTSLAGLSRNMGRNQPARDYYARALALHRQVGNRSAEAVTLGNLAGLLCSMGLFELSRAHYEASLRIYQALGNRQFEAFSRNGMGVLAFACGRPREAIAHYEAALALHEEHHALPAVANVRDNLGLIHLDQGDLPAALDHLRRALTAHRSLGSSRSEALVLGWLGTSAAIAGDWAQAEERFGDALERMHALGLTADARSVHRGLADLAVVQGRLDAAADHLAAAERGIGPQPRTRLVRAQLELASGRATVALDTLRGALEVAGAKRDARFEGRLHLEVGRVHLATHDADEAARHLEQAVAALRDTRSRRWLAEALACSAQASAALGRPIEAQASLEEATSLGVHEGCGPRSPVVEALSAALQSLP